MSVGHYRNPIFEPEYGKFVLEDMVTQAGARILYDATCMDVVMEGACIEAALFHTKGGVMAVHARQFIDSTGDADLSAMAGVPYESGGVDFGGFNMSTTLGSRWTGANFTVYSEASKRFQEEQLASGVGKPCRWPGQKTETPVGRPGQSRAFRRLCSAWVK